MRFGIKTAPMNTTWADMLAVWKEAGAAQPDGQVSATQGFVSVSGPIEDSVASLIMYGALSRFPKLNSQTSRTAVRGSLRSWPP